MHTNLHRPAHQAASLHLYPPPCSQHPLPCTSRTSPTRVLLQERILAMEELLEEVQDRMDLLVAKPSTRVQACQLLAKTKVRTQDHLISSIPDLLTT